MSTSTERFSSTSPAASLRSEEASCVHAAPERPALRRLVRLASSRIGVASATAVIVGLASAAVHVALVREHTDGSQRAASVSLAAWSRALERAEAETRIDPTRLAHLRPAALRTTPGDTCVVSRSATSSVADVARHATQHLATRSTADAFNAALIADFLRTPPRPHHRPHAVAHGRRPTSPTLVVTQLDAAGIGVASEPPASQGGGRAAVAALAGADATPRRQAPNLAGGVWGFDSGSGRVETDARAGTLNGQPAASLDLGVTEDGVRFNAAGTSEVTSFDPATLRRGFKATTGASIPLD